MRDKARNYTAMIQVRTWASLKKKIRKLAIDRGMTMADLVSDILLEFVERGRRKE